VLLSRARYLLLQVVGLNRDAIILNELFLLEELVEVDLAKYHLKPLNDEVEGDSHLVFQPLNFLETLSHLELAE
jgi:hypothetical protein